MCCGDVLQQQDSYTNCHPLLLPARPLVVVEPGVATCMVVCLCDAAASERLITMQGASTSFAVTRGPAARSRSWHHMTFRLLQQHVATEHKAPNSCRCQETHSLENVPRPSHTSYAQTLNPSGAGGLQVMQHLYDLVVMQLQPAHTSAAILIAAHLPAALGSSPAPAGAQGVGCCGCAPVDLQFGELRQHILPGPLPTSSRELHGFGQSWSWQYTWWALPMSANAAMHLSHKSQLGGCEAPCTELASAPVQSALSTS